MSEPKFKHYLRFNDLPLIGTIQISEPFKFDGSTISVEQEKGRHSRTLNIFNADTSLELNRSNFELLTTSQILPDGNIFNYASQGFDYVKSEINKKGFEVNIEYVLEFENNLYSTGKLDSLTWEIRKDTITFNIVQNTLMKIIKVNEDILIDAFNDKDLEGNDIEPCQTHDIFLKAKPLLKKSTLEYPSRVWATGGIQNIIYPRIQTYFLVHINLINAGISKSFTPFQPSTQFIENTVQEFKVIEAVDTFSEFKLNLSNLKFTYNHVVNDNADTGGGTKSSLELKMYIFPSNYDSGFPFDPYFGLTKYSLFYHQNTEDFNVSTSFDENIELTINEVINSGDKIIIFYEADLTSRTSDVDYLDLSRNTHFIFESGKLDIQVVSNAVSTVVKGIRLSDLMQHQARSVGFTLSDAVFGVGTEYYNNFVMNGRMLGNFNNLPFNNKFKDVFQSFCDEAFADYQINDTNVTINKINEFYNDVELAVFEEIPSLSNTVKPNIDYALKQIEIAFKSSSDSRTGNAEDTIDDVHTSMQVNFPSENTDGILKLDFNHIRSAQLIEEQRRKGNEVEQKTKALENDEKLFVIDCIEIPVGQTNEFSQFLSYQITVPNILKVLSNGTFNWNNLGMVAGQQVSIKVNNVVTLFEVQELTEYIATFEYLNNFPTVNVIEEGLLVFNYVLIGVNYTNRTNEGFSLIEGVENPQNYSNLKFTLKRILNKWSSILSIASQYLPNKELKVTEIKVNNKLETRLTSETETVVDFEPILTNDIINDKFLNGKVYTYKVFSRFDSMLELANNVRNTAGFVRILTSENEVVKGFINKMNYKINSQELDLTLFGKYENDVIELSNYISQIGTFEVVNDFVTIYDVNGLKLFNTNYLTNFSINENVYTDEVEFSENLLTLLT